MKPTRFNDMSTIINNRPAPEFSNTDGLVPVTAQDLDDLERQCLGVIQAIRRIRGKPPLVTPNQQRKAVREPRK